MVMLRHQLRHENIDSDSSDKSDDFNINNKDRY